MVNQSYILFNSVYPLISIRAQTNCKIIETFYSSLFWAHFLELPLNFQHTSFQSSHFFSLIRGPLASGCVMDSVVCCVGSASQRNRLPSRRACLSSPASPCWAPRPEEACTGTHAELLLSDESFQGLRRFWAMGKIPFASLRPGSLQASLSLMKHDRWPSWACRHTRARSCVWALVNCSFFSWAQNTFPWLLSSPCSLRTTCGGSTRRSCLSAWVEQCTCFWIKSLTPKSHIFVPFLPFPFLWSQWSNLLSTFNLIKTGAGLGFGNGILEFLTPDPGLTFWEQG